MKERRKMPVKLTKKELERAARIYRNCTEAGRAFGMYGRSFKRACINAGVVPPS